MDVRDDPYRRHGMFFISRGDPAPAPFSFSSSRWDPFAMGPEQHKHHPEQHKHHAPGDGFCGTVTLPRHM
ncbi:hypothetical protein AV530_004413 [Patagioenas fasciata monilis]|uniref:Uncharacterized protein n=1 Tax=Patagioenas fasciata monilis TaxID=372326 RepID=A0A1V4J152_PATFA|nr:hypothetical protein AV530_004413 [Patagioenas fasciata monilis]